MKTWGRMLSFAFVALLVSTPPIVAEETALDRYVHTHDDVYRWEIKKSTDGDAARTFILELTSQTWRSKSEIDRPVWKHWLLVVVPHNLRSDQAFLYITGGDNDSPMPDEVSPMVRQWAEGTGTVAAELRMVPNQPITFTDTPDEKREEDNLVAYSRLKFFETKDPTWLVRLAMVKSGVRAMDAITELLGSKEGGMKPIKRFVVAGGSKRGWTTWLVGVVDHRVEAIVPIVIDALNSERVTRHHYEAYGFFSPALNDYVRHGLFPGKIGTPEYGEVLAIEDPYNYRGRDRLKIPKYIVNATGDEFFLPDNWQFSFRELQGEKHLYYVPNAKHNLKGSDASQAIQTFYQMVVEGKPRPKYTWVADKDGGLTVTMEDKPSEINVWTATNPDARDFRLDIIGPAFEKSAQPIPSSTGETVFTWNPPAPKKGYSAYFIELVYDVGLPYPFKATTGVRISPDVLPFKWENAFKSN